MILEGKKAIVTGGRSGIGRAAALKLASEGADVAVFGRTYDESVIKEIQDMGRNAYFYEVDVASFDAVKEAVDDAAAKMGSIDILVNSAGITKDGLIAMMNEDAFDQVIDINLKGTFNTIKHCYRYFIKQKSGKIVNITSVSGLTGNAGQANYSASKAGVVGLTKTVAKELAGRGICCNAIAPGFIETLMTENLKESPLMKSIPMKRMGKPEEVAELVLFLASDRASYITGEVIRIDGGIAM